jgi:hypothetical protein
VSDLTAVVIIMPGNMATPMKLLRYLSNNSDHPLWRMTGALLAARVE